MNTMAGAPTLKRTGFANSDGGSAKGAASNQSASLDDRYELEKGRVFLSGNHALVRLIFEQMRRDRRNGLNTASFVTGYPGSPLGGTDNILRAARKFHEKYNVVHQPAANEELAATSLIGTQMIEDHPDPRVDGVVGYWYGKGPGIDRSGDALKHGNFAGTSTHGAVVILSGEDHEAKSSSVPYANEFAFEHFGIPVIYPASVEEFVTLGQHAVAMSRFSGCWVSLKLVAPLCDGGETVEVDPEDPAIVVPELEINGKPFEKRTDFTYFPGTNLRTEQELYEERHAAVRAYARANQLDQTVISGSQDTLGIIAAGKTYSDLRQALEMLGFDEERLNAAGIRIRKMGLIAPIEETGIEEFARGLKEIIVIEEKRDYLERQIARVICNAGLNVRVLGKQDEDGKKLFPVAQFLTADTLATLLGQVLAKRDVLPVQGCAALEAQKALGERTLDTHLHRMPNYCSGCPHNRGTRLAPGQVAWGSPGCHFFAALQEDPQRTIKAVTQYGGEGLPWIGLSPFTGREHMVQNVGDGSLYHSSYLNIRYAVQTGVKMTYKILDNGAIANTGGQQPAPGRTTEQLVKLLELEGVSKIVVCTKDTDQYRSSGFGSLVEIRPIDEMEEVMAELEKIDGVTIALHDGACANERKRKQKRGLAPKPQKFTVVNEDVCEDCGDCGRKANCMSLQKVETPFGTKTRIHQSSCHQDQACLEGECPSFVTVTTIDGNGVRKPVPPTFANDFPEPEMPALNEPFRIYAPGLGGTGVITVNAILAEAATREGIHVRSYDQTGASQKWGSVLSSLILSPHGEEPWSNATGPGEADLYLALDLLAAADNRFLDRCAADRTGAVINTSMLPSSQMIRDNNLRLMADPIADSIAKVTDPQRTMRIDARAIAESLFGDFIMTNMIAIGAAYQSGLLPISAAGIENAIELNGVKKADNITAFRAGRMAVCQPEKLEQFMTGGPVLFANRHARDAAAPSAAQQAVLNDIAARFGQASEATLAVLNVRGPDLVGYQNARWAQRYVDRIAALFERELSVFGRDWGIARAAATHLHRFMANKDEYETGRLLTQKRFRQQVEETFEGPVKISYNLQPPLLRKFGLKRKVALPSSVMNPLLKVMYGMRFVRGTTFDPFGYSPYRKEERELLTWYEGVIDAVDARMEKSLAPDLIDILQLADGIRGYEDVRRENAARVKSLTEEKLTAPARGAFAAPRSQLQVS